MTYIRDRAARRPSAVSVSLKKEVNAMTDANTEQEILQQIAAHVQTGKADADTNIPPGSKGEPGVAEWVQKGIDAGVSASVLIEQGLLGGMQPIGKKFAANEIFIPEVLIAARAMHAGMNKLKPLLADADIKSRGVFVIGTVKGDLHDIGKNLVAMIMEGAGWQVVDLGVDCGSEKYLEAVKAHPGCVVGLSALLTTTMVAQKAVIELLEERGLRPGVKVLVGGAPVSAAWAREIGADGTAPDAMGASELACGLLDGAAGA